MEGVQEWSCEANHVYGKGNWGADKLTNLDVIQLWEA